MTRDELKMLAEDAAGRSPLRRPPTATAVQEDHLAETRARVQAYRSQFGLSESDFRERASLCHSAINPVVAAGFGSVDKASGVSCHRRRSF